LIGDSKNKDNTYIKLFILNNFLCYLQQINARLLNQLE